MDSDDTELPYTPPQAPLGYVWYQNAPLTEVSVKEGSKTVIRDQKELHTLSSYFPAALGPALLEGKNDGNADEMVGIYLATPQPQI